MALDIGSTRVKSRISCKIGVCIATCATCPIDAIAVFAHVPAEVLLLAICLSDRTFVVTHAPAELRLEDVDMSVQVGVNAS